MTTSLRAVLVSVAAFLVAAAVFPAESQAQGTRYEVKKGDTLFKIARDVSPQGASINQMFAAIVRANADAFSRRGVHVLKPGQVLNIPDAAQVTAISAGDARREVTAATSKSPLPIPQEPTAAIRPSTPMPPDAAQRRYAEGLELEKAGKHEEAFKAFLDAGENGNGLAQRKLGQIYDKGTPAVKRDYETSLLWYRKAREQGVEIPKPIQRTTPRQ